MGDNFNWVLRRHSPGTDEETGTGTERRSTPGSHKDESSDDEAPSESPMEEYPPDLATSSTITLQNTVMMEAQHRASPLSGSS